MAAVTVLVAVPVLKADFSGPGGPREEFRAEGAVAARVDEAVLYVEDLPLLGLDPADVREWSRDELLARAAEEEGLENPRVSRILQQRARQVYLRDRMVERLEGSLAVPTEQEALGYMRSHPDEFLLERHYYHILLADSALADSIHRRLAGGDNFQTTAQRVSLNQKAAVGGDLGFVTGGEVFLAGLPREAASLQGISPVYETPGGWQILMATDTRPLEDTTRVAAMVREYLFNQRLEAALDSVASGASRRFDCEVNL
jgi:hypothetical protein